MRFLDLPGQAAAVAAVKGMLAEDRLPHALLLTGPEGVGKLPLAQALSQRLLCHHPDTQPGLLGTPSHDSCGQCPACLQAAALQHPDQHLVLPMLQVKSGKSLTSDDELDAFRTQWTANPYLSLRQWVDYFDAGNKQPNIAVEEIRNLLRKLSLTSFGGGYKTIVIWQADRMNLPAANALLKVLEEPAPRTAFILTCTDPERLLPTILSRCQRLVLAPLPHDAIADHLQKHLSMAPAQAHELARLSRGSLSRAMTLSADTDQPLVDQFMAWMRLCQKGRLTDLKPWVDEAARLPRETQKLLLEVALDKIRDALMTLSHAGQLVAAAEAEHTFLQKFGDYAGANALHGMAQRLEAAIAHLGRNANTNLLLLNLSLDISQYLRRRR